MNLKHHAVVKVILVLLIGVSLLIIGAGFRPSPTPTLALIMKVIPDVTKKIGTADWSAAGKSDQLAAGDQVKTGKRALAILKFLDKSIVRMREESEITLGSDAAGKFTKVVQLGGGAVGFDIKKQTNERFRFTSPTSVASIRGTKGKWSGGQGNDTLVIGEGLANLKNEPSGKDLDIPAGFIGFSSKDGSLSSRPATPEELADADLAATGGSPSELNLEMRDSKGNKKEFKIKFKQ